MEFVVKTPWNEATTETLLSSSGCKGAWLSVGKVVGGACPDVQVLSQRQWGEESAGTVSQVV